MQDEQKVPKEVYNCCLRPRYFDSGVPVLIDPRGWGGIGYKNKNGMKFKNLFDSFKLFPSHFPFQNTEWICLGPTHESLHHSMLGSTSSTMMGNRVVEDPNRVTSHFMSSFHPTKASHRQFGFEIWFSWLDITFQFFLFFSNNTWATSWNCIL